MAKILPLIMMCLGVSAARTISKDGLGISNSSPSSGTMLLMLDAMQQLMTGSGEFDRNLYSELTSCMNTFDSRLTDIQDSAWRGIVDYWDIGGGPADAWGGTPTNYTEHNITETNIHGMTIYEPCDYASNVAYFHDVIEFCKRKARGQPFSLSEEYYNGLGKAFSSLTMGSAFMHGSNTWLGRQQDRRVLRAVAYLIHQGSLSNIVSNSSILHDLSELPRARSSLQLVHEFLNMYSSLPVTTWYDTTETFDMPEYMLSFSGIIGTVLTLGFDPEVVDMIIPALADAFKMPEDLKVFLLDKYIPEIRKATAHVNLSVEKRTEFLGNAFATVMKLIYGFLWQERVLTKSTFFLDPVVNYIGWELLPGVNDVANQFSTYDHFDAAFQKGERVYPGSEWCNPVIPHAKWHLESGIGMLDLTYLADEMCGIISYA